MFNNHDISRDQYMLDGSFAYQGYDWWWHSFTARRESDGEEVPFFIEFFLCNPAHGGNKAILGQSEKAKEKQLKPSYLMVKVGCWGKNKVQLNRFIPWSEVSIKRRGAFEISALDCYVSEKRLFGSVHVSDDEAADRAYMSDVGSMIFDLTLDKKIAFNVGYGASEPFRRMKAFEMYWHAEGMKTYVAGDIWLNGEKYKVIPECSYGYADKNWGRNFTTPWVWLSSNCLRSRITGKELKNSAFDIGGGRPKVFFTSLGRKLLSAFYYEGKEYEFNFSKVLDAVNTRFKSYEDDEYVYWKVWQESRTAFVKVSARCRKDDMLFINYEAPDGTKRHNHLYNGGNAEARIRLYEKKNGRLYLVDDIDATHVGCEYGEMDR